MLLTGKNNHVFICGMTRSGKTYFATHGLAELQHGVLYFNLQNTELPGKYITARADKITMNDLIGGLRKGHKIDLRFPAALKMDEIQNIIAFATQLLLKAGFSEQNPIYIAYDECQLLAGECENEVRLAATRGLYLGCRCVFITQRPALADLTFYTQSAEQYIFQLGKGERQYFNAKGIDYDECLKLWQQYGEHSYIYTDGFKLEGRPAI